MLVSADNFTRAESDLYFGNVVKDGGFGKFKHIRQLTPMDKQLVIRSNRDTLYSAGVFDLDAGPVTISLPDAHDRFMSLQVISEDHYVPDVFYGQGEHTLTRDGIGTRYVMAAIRTLVDPNDEADAERVHALQDAVAVKQDSSGSFEIPDWDPVSHKSVRDALLQLAATLPDSKGMFGTRSDTDPIRHLLGSAAAWGGNPEKDAMYFSFSPAGTTAPPRTGSASTRCRSTASGRSPSTTTRATSRPTRKTPTRSTTSPPKGSRRPDHHSVRRLRRHGAKLFTDHAGLELPGPVVPTTPSNPQRRVEYSPRPNRFREIVACPPHVADERVAEDAERPLNRNTAVVIASFPEPGSSISANRNARIQMPNGCWGPIGFAQVERAATQARTRRQRP